MAKLIDVRTGDPSARQPAEELGSHPYIRDNGWGFHRVALAQILYRSLQCPAIHWSLVS